MELFKNSSRKRLLRARGFLNEKRGMAAYEASVSLSSYKDKKKKEHRSLSAHLTISDCDNQVHLYFGFDKKDRKKCLRKIKRLLEVVKKLEAAMRRGARKL